MNRRKHLRNVAVAAFTIFILFLVATQQLAVQAAPQQAPLAQATGLELVTTGTIIINPNSSGTVRFRLTSPETRAFTLSQSVANGNITFSFPSGATVNASANVPVEFDIQVNVPSNAVPGASFNQALQARSTSPTDLTFSRSFTVIVGGSTPTPTVTTTGTTGPTATRGPVCADGFEGDNNPASAKVIDVNTAQERTICPAGDEDWLVFGGVAGKVYTIDVSRMDPGIDLTLELFDPNLNSIAFNDDFFNRDPANPNPGDIRPRITIRIPFDGRYYIKVRDAAGRGGVNYFYVIALLDESYGPTPTLVREVCQDLFEPDGLPEQARLLTSNEIQEDRRLCPAGDADWITFFAKAGKRYIIYTDTRRYRGRNEVNGETQAGADTVMILTDRDGVSLIDFNDDIPGGSSLDSQIEFTPDVDGFYFVQVKNTGDIGNQFIRYDLVLLLCVPGQTDCGRASVPGTPVVPLTPAPTGTPDDEFNLDPTNTPRPTVTNTITP
jgi:hypothetical protein